MKISYFLLFLLPFLMPACDKESCSDTDREQISFNIIYSVYVKYLDGNEAVDVPIKVAFQKWWCEGDYSIIASDSGYTNDFGHFIDKTSWQIELSNDFDYEMITFTIAKGTEYEITETDKYYYSDIDFNRNGDFHIIKSYVLNL